MSHIVFFIMFNIMYNKNRKYRSMRFTVWNVVRKSYHCSCWCSQDWQAIDVIKISYYWYALNLCFSPISFILFYFILFFLGVFFFFCALMPLPSLYHFVTCVSHFLFNALWLVVFCSANPLVCLMRISVLMHSFLIRTHFFRDTSRVVKQGLSVFLIQELLCHYTSYIQTWSFA